MNFRQLWALVFTCYCLLISSIKGSPAFKREESGELLVDVITKTVISSKFRLVYFVGVEGTGHNFFSQVFKQMFSAHDDLQYVESCNIGMSTYLPITMRRVNRYGSNIDVMREELRMMAASEETLPSFGTVATVQRTHPLQHENCASVGQLSYPNNHGPNKAQAYPDLRVVAEVSEQEGVDIRFLYLQRSAWDMTISNTKHRAFHKHLLGVKVKDNMPEDGQFMQYMHILLTNIAVLESMLEELGPGFIVCHQFDKIDDPEQAHDVAKFLTPSSEVARYLEEAILQYGRPHHGDQEPLPFKGADKIVERLQQKLDSFEAKYCDF